jgi:two-component system nitrogen regulation response regulator GlnG
MAAIPHDLIESELFGHEKGAFTGATQRREGRFQQADGGTLFLDEIGDMPPEAQTRLLRVLANGEFYLVGGHTPSKVDVRIIAATHQNLEKLVAENRFREDLFHRLNVIRIHLPTLADRREDIPRLMQHFLQHAAKELETEPKTLSAEVENYLTTLPWEGNVRQLENICRWLTVMASGREVHLEDLPQELVENPVDKNSLSSTSLNSSLNSTLDSTWEQQLRYWADNELANGKNDILKMAVPTFERALIETALSHTNGRKKDAAELLGWGRNTLTRKLKELGMGDEG